MADSRIEQALREALALHQSGQLSEAEPIYRRILAERPTHADSLHLLGFLNFQKGQVQSAVEMIQQAIQLRPEAPVYHNNLGTVFEKSGRTEAAVAAYRNALRLDPNYAEAHCNLGNVLQTLGLLDEAIACYETALSHSPGYFPAQFNLGNLFKEQGQMDEAVARYRRAVELNPSLSSIHSNLLLALHYDVGCSASELAEEHRRWNMRHASPLKPLIRPHGNVRDEERPLRIGYVSPDFCAHAVARFLLPLLENHNHACFRIFAYSDVSVPDCLTARIESHVDGWRDSARMDDAQLAELIRQDEIDVLVDLAGHTAKGRLLAFARRPAPVQVYYLAYCSTTGLDAMDYRITDPFLDPEGTDLANYAEKSLHLPKTYWCYSAPDLPLRVGPMPEPEVGLVTFGCLNNFCKVSDVTLQTWGNLLRAVPNSRLLLCAGTNRQRLRVQEALCANGVERSRVRYVGVQSFSDYMATYQQIDIGLDPFPFTGGTTTCDALWMGVPVVSLAGRTAVSRGGLSLLSNVGLPEFVARTEDDYVRIAMELATDRPRREKLRDSLRARLQASPVMDGRAFARNIEATFRNVWRIWCRTARGGTTTTAPDWTI
ncbi:MAG: tetratricopeptide repeat protein [Verrucomicrobia bacterium]|nr:tetratricopeptide repeat protein [Verrucomicrobiota bacterium]